MTSLLSFANVSKSYPDGGRDVCVLDAVSFELDPGGSLGVYGPRRSGKSTLLRLAAGIELADAGTVSFGGADLAAMRASARAHLLRNEIAFMATGDWHVMAGERVVDHVATSLCRGGVTMRNARRRALTILDRVGIGASAAEEAAAGLSVAERMRVMLAQALAREPRLLVVDEPALASGIRERERFQAVLRDAAAEGAIALLLASEEMAALQGTQVLVSISAGELCSTAAGTVIPLHARTPARRRRRDASR
jgi:putative ABC transport system ATP-binding protein